MARNGSTLQTVLQGLLDKEIIAGKPMSANELSRHCGVPQSTLSRILKGQSKDVRRNVLEKIAAYFRITVGQLRGEEPLADDGFAGKAVLANSTANRTEGEVIAVQGTEMYLTFIDAIEGNLLTYYRLANAQGRSAIITTAEAFSKQHPDLNIVKLKR